MTALAAFSHRQASDCSVTPVVPAPRVAQTFSRAAECYDQFALFQRPSARQLVTLVPHAATGPWLDLGCGTADVWSDLIGHAPQATWLGLDLAAGMVRTAQQRHPVHGFVQGDACQLPLLSESLQGVYSNLMAQWLCPDDFLREQYRVLQPGGTLVFSTLLEHSLYELQRAYLQVGDSAPVNPQRTAHAYHSAIQASGFEFVHWQDIPLTQEFPDLRAVFHSLKGTGAVASAQGRQRGLLGRQWWHHMQQAYPKTAEGKYPLTFNVGYAQLRKPR
ncbi:methyltransferase domain-containing protein [Salinispirillum sp. LH 10-3-1]|uniref:Methyltransferase domain-containing protein n=1 Tax=Salinispirillum sp. LH 10-3-1 TaxID=2952525 RepID=A0AB38YEE5_9GAMM